MSGWRDQHGLPVAIPSAYEECRAAAAFLRDAAEAVEVIETSLGGERRVISLSELAKKIEAAKSLIERVEAYARRIERETAEFEFPAGYIPLQPLAWPRFRRRAVP